MSDEMGDRMKVYERAEAGRRFMPLLPIVVRLDGRSFSNWTRNLTRPYDERLSQLMVDVTVELVKEANARVGYTQSDEITLVLLSEAYDSQVYFDGKVQKIVSVLAAECAARFNAAAELAFSGPPYPADRTAVFDCRAWQVPNYDEAANAVLWREFDATKNAISMAARHYYPHADLHGRHGGEMQELLFQKGVNFNDYPAFFKRGTYIQRRVTAGKPTPDELAALPPKHHAHTDPDFTVERSSVRVRDLPPLAKVTNRVGVLLFGEDPVMALPPVA